MKKNPENTHHTSLISDADPYLDMLEILSGKRSDDEIIQFLTTHSPESCTPAQLLAFLEAIRDTAEYTIDADSHEIPVVDIAGTGGDQKNTVNISTLAALIVASTKHVVTYKYGNRSASGVCGSMDVLEDIGINIELGPDDIQDRHQQTNFIPLFARLAYPGAKNVAAARKSFGKPSLFNFLFPLARPVRGNYSYVMGFSKAQDMYRAAEMLRMEQNTALLVHGEDGTDEISVANAGLTRYVYLHQGNKEEGEIDARKVFGIEPVDLSLLQITDRDEAVAFFIDALNPDVSGEKVEAIRTAALANAAAALAITQPELPDINDNIQESLGHVTRSLMSGQTLQLVKNLQN